ncbi:hypothetical protein PCCS19_49510 [Paenibacillus sp. CCS19]|uniref:YEATS-associated helix-containing protein n=1 Tax=Paenibacillus sp. CCS19 TaxID=3158387 RepID=UPI00256C3434|nr:YEATS-associated helix-containing protein [Paenibacillus cellulosilyticus]GMK41892.1 hypothetical protein PCCS19_49510 [Paenibacillus cellulosilyticus]
MWDQILLVATMALAGILGGAASYLLSSSQRDSPPVFKDRTFYRTVFIGLVASFLVPVFLQLIASDLIDQTLNAGELAFNKLLIVAGYCLIVAISSRKFIEMITNATLDRVKSTMSSVSDDVAMLKAAHTEGNIEPARAIINESGNATATPDNDAANAAGEMTDVLHAQGIRDSAVIVGAPTASHNKGSQRSPADNAQYQVLKALVGSPYMFRSIDGIKSDAGLPESTVNKTLSQLLDDKLVVQSFSTQGARYNITQSGRERLIQYNSNSNS